MAYGQIKDVSACACGVTPNPIFIKNTGDVPSTYAVTQAGDASAWSATSPGSFTLNPGEQKQLVSYISIPCGTSEDRILTTNVETQFGLKKQLQQTIAARNCPNVNVQVKADLSNRYFPCDPLTYELVLSNSGSFDETYKISLPKFPQYASLSENYVTIPAGQSMSAFVYLNLPCDVYGKQDFDLEVSAQRSGFLGTTTVPLQIKPDYDYEITAPGEVRTGNEESQFDITLKNTASVANTYKLTSEQSYISIANSTIFLWPDESANISVKVQQFIPGNYNFSILSMTTRGSVARQLTTHLIVEKYHSVDVSISKRQDTVANCQNITYNVAVKNDGTRKNTYAMTLTGPAWAGLSLNGSSELNPGEEKMLPLKVDIPCTFEGMTRVRVNASVSGRPVTDSAVLDFNILSSEDAFRVDISPKPSTLYYKNENIPVEIEHSGAIASTYTVSVKGADWIVPDTQEITLEPGKKTTINLKTSPSGNVKEGAYGVELSLKPKGRSVSFAKKFNVMLLTAPWYVKFGRLLNTYKLYIGAGVAALIAIAILVYLIRRFSRYVKRKKIERLARKESELFEAIEKPKKRTWPWALLILFIIALLASAGLAAYFYMTQPKVTETPLISVDSTGLKGFGNTIFLDNFDKKRITVVLHNPFEDTLAYSIKSNATWIVPSTDHIELEKNETKRIYLDVDPNENIPDGEYKIRISARLPKDNKIYTESITLVLKRFDSIWKKYIWYFVAGFGILVILLPLLAFLLRKKIKDFTQDHERLSSEISRAEKRIESLIERPWKTETKIHEPRKKRSWKWLWVLLLILALLGAATSGVYLLGNVNFSRPQAPTPIINPNETSKLLVSINRTGLEGVGNVVVIKGTKEVVIPLILQNVDEEKAAYDIKVSNTSFVRLSDSKISLNQSETKVLNIIVDPKKISGKDVELRLDIRLKDQNLAYSERVVLELRSSGLRTLKEIATLYWPYMAAGFVLAALVLIVNAVKRRTKKDVREVLEEFAEEKKQKEKVLHKIKKEITEVKKKRKSAKTGIGLKK